MLIAGERGGRKEGQRLLPALTETTKARVLQLATTPLRLGRAVTPVGRALQKHAARPGSAFTGATGNAAHNTAVGRQYLLNILDDPTSTVSHAQHPVFGNVVKVRRTDGSGFWFKENGEFIGFLEKYLPR